MHTDLWMAPTPDFLFRSPMHPVTVAAVAIIRTPQVFLRSATSWTQLHLPFASIIHRLHVPSNSSWIPRTPAWLDESCSPPDMLTQDFDIISISDYEDENDSDLGVQSFDGDEEMASEVKIVKRPSNGASSMHERNIPGSEPSWDLLSSPSVDTEKHHQYGTSCTRCSAIKEPTKMYCKLCKQDIDSSMQFLELDRHELSDYECAGRLPEITFSDLRSASKSKKRWRADQEKYYGYRYIKPAQLNALHYQSSDPPCSLVPFSAPLNDSPTTIMTKRKFYREAQKAPRPPTYHRRKHIKNYSPWRERYIVRMKERKHACQRIDEELDEI